MTCSLPSVAPLLWIRDEAPTDFASETPLTIEATPVVGFRDGGLASSATGGVSLEAPARFLGTGSRSVEMWIKTSGTDQRLFEVYECGGICQGSTTFQLSVDAAGHAEMQVRDSDAPSGYVAQRVIGTTLLDDDVWHHVAGVMDVDTDVLQVYVDGVLDASVPLAADNQAGLSVRTDDDMLIGYGRVGGSSSLRALLDTFDEVLVYDVALTAADIADRHAAGVLGVCEDVDGDGFLLDDCDRADPDAYPLAPEISTDDGVDSNCDLSDFDASAYSCVTDTPHTLFSLDATFNGTDASGTVSATTTSLDDGLFGPGVVGTGKVRGPHGGAFDGTDFLTGSLTVDGWVRTTSAGILAEFYQCGGFCNGSGVFRVSVDNDGHLQGAYRLGDLTGVDADFATGTTDIADGGWHHVAVVVDRTAAELRVFVDGIRETTTALSASNTGTGSLANTGVTPDDFTIGYGRAPAGPPEAHLLRYDEVAFHDEAVPDARIAAIHAAGPAGRCVTP
jgi:hypothetical protein